MKKILITTTDSLYGWEIEAYLKPVFASVVIGANAIADIGASFTDFFGGRSNSYEKRLQLLKDNAIAILTSKASELGANCILGLKVDLDEISGKGNQMFMITACGTAVIAKNLKSQTDSKHNMEIDKELVKDSANTIRLMRKFQSPDTLISVDELRMIVNTKSTGFKDFMIAKLKSVSSKQQDPDFEQAIELYKEYFVTIDPRDSIPVLYEALLNDTDDSFLRLIVSIIKDNDLLDFEYVNKLLDEDIMRRKLGLNVALSHKPGYSSDDVPLLEKTIEHIKNGFPKITTSSMKKGFLSSAEKEVWLCPCGSTNSVDNVTCFNCYKDQYGFAQDELKPNQYVEVLSNRVLALKSLL